MPEIYLKKHNGMLIPADEDAEEAIRKLKFGTPLKVRYSVPRNYANHKRFFAFLKATFDMQEHFFNLEHYRRWLIMKAGRYTAVTSPNGKKFYLPDSIAFDSMEEDVFQQLFSDCIDAFLQVWGDRISRNDILRAVEFAS